MKNNCQQDLKENQKVLNQLNKNFFENIITVIVYFFLFIKVNGKFSNEQKIFIHLSNEQNFISKLVFIFSLVIFCIISLLTIIYLLKRFFLKRFLYIKSNLFFLNNQWIISLNCLLKICNYAVLIISFVSLQRLLLTLVFISLLNLLETRRNFEFQLNPGFFSWKNIRLRKLFIYSLVLAISIPTYNVILTTSFAQKLKDNINKVINETRESFSSETDKFINDFFSSIPFIPLLSIAQKILQSFFTEQTKGAFFIIPLLNSLKNTIEDDISSFKNFWKELATTTKKVEWFRLSVNFQLAMKEKKVKKFGQIVNSFSTIFCYESFILNPFFIRQSYIEDINSFSEKFIEKIEIVNKFIILVNNKISKQQEKTFIFYWLFNHIKSFEEFFLYNKLLNG